MEEIPKSGLYYPNRVVRIVLKALEDVLGINGVHALLNYAHLNLIIQSPPPADLEKAFDFSNFSSLFIGLDDLYGPRGARGLAMRTGREMFTQSLAMPDSWGELSEQVKTIEPESVRLLSVLSSIVDSFNKISDQTMSVEEQGEELILNIHRCAVCWGRKTDLPTCALVTGLIKQALSWATNGKEFPVEETQCMAQGAETCRWSIGKTPLEA